MASDDQEVMAWYLQGWCFFLMAEQAKDTGTKIEDLSWEELARDSRDCLENCKTVSFFPNSSHPQSSSHIIYIQLHASLQHPDEGLLHHTKELIGQLDALGVKPRSGHDEDDDEGADGEWEDVDDSDEDVEMS